MSRNITLYPWFRFFHNLVFWQAVWFLYFQDRLSAADAILIYVLYDLSTTILEVPSGYLSDRLGRKVTLVLSALCGVISASLQAMGGAFIIFAIGQVFLGASGALASGTDSALLYESLDEEGRKDEIETQELRAWRFSFAALALSAVIGGVMSFFSPSLPFWGVAVAFAIATLIAVNFREPGKKQTEQKSELARLASLKTALVQPTLLWLFVLSALMYVFSHLPFVFGQPFIFEALEQAGFAAEAPLVSGGVSATMMVVSVAASFIVVGLRDRIGLPAILLLAFGMQIVLCFVLALTNSVLAIAFLFLRMVPDSLSRPFILARIQPMLENESRATYLSLQSLSGRIIFAGTLYVAAGASSQTSQMAYGEIQTILAWYVVAGVVVLAVLALTARRARVAPS